MPPADGAPAGAPTLLAERAPAKVNLTLHVLGRRRDGYHELDSLVAFAGASDTLTLDPRPGAPATLAVTGPLAPAAGPPDDNLVLRAERALRARVPGLVAGAFHLVKRLPVAAGIGGGSSDAAAALRLLARANALEGDPRLAEAARETGADVPVCLDPSARRMRGAGEALGRPLALRLTAVLVNPGVPTPTAAVFRQLGLQPGETLPDRAPHPEDDTGIGFLARLAGARNDLEAPALAVAPAIRDALAQMSGQPGCRLARMSGSGSTVFGLFDDCRASAAAARALRSARPAWWVRPTLLR